MEATPFHPTGGKQPESHVDTRGSDPNEPIGPPPSLQQLMLEALGINGRLEIRRVRDDDPAADVSGTS